MSDSLFGFPSEALSELKQVLSTGTFDPLFQCSLVDLGLIVQVDKGYLAAPLHNARKFAEWSESLETLRGIGERITVRHLEEKAPEVEDVPPTSIDAIVEEEFDRMPETFRELGVPPEAIQAVQEAPKAEPAPSTAPAPETPAPAPPSPVRDTAKPRYSKRMPDTLRAARKVVNLMEDLGIADILLSQVVTAASQANDIHQIDSWVTGVSLWMEGKDAHYIEIYFPGWHKEWLDRANNVTGNTAIDTAISEIMAKVPTLHKDANSAIIQGFIEAGVSEFIVPLWNQVKAGEAEGRVTTPVKLWRFLMNEQVENRNREQVRVAERMTEAEIHEIFRPYVPSKDRINELDADDQGCFALRLHDWRQLVPNMAQLGWGGNVGDFWFALWHGRQPRATEYNQAIHEVWTKMDAEGKGYIKTSAQAETFVPEFFQRLLDLPCDGRLNVSSDHQRGELSYQIAESFVKWLRKYQSVILNHPVFGPIFEKSKVYAEFVKEPVK